METTTVTLTTSNAALAGGILGAMLGTIITFIIIFYILTVIASWKILEKAGEPGWKALIPIYNVYILYKIVGMKNWFWSAIVISIVASFIITALGYNTNMTAEQFAAIEPTKLTFIYIITILEVVYFIVMSAVYASRTSRAFGHGTGFAIGLFFLTNIFWLILGFGKSKYNKKVALK